MKYIASILLLIWVVFVSWCGSKVSNWEIDRRVALWEITSYECKSSNCNGWYIELWQLTWREITGDDLKQWYLLNLMNQLRSSKEDHLSMNIRENGKDVFWCNISPDKWSECFPL